MRFIKFFSDASSMISKTYNLVLKKSSKEDIYIAERKYEKNSIIKRNDSWNDIETWEVLAPIIYKLDKYNTSIINFEDNEFKLDEANIKNKRFK